MRTYFVILIVSAIAAFVATPIVRRLAFRIGAVDEPSPRKVHRIPMPRLGGVAVMAGMSVPWFGLYLVRNQVAVTFQNYERMFGALMLGAVAMVGLGVYDDIKGASPWQKLFVQAAVSVALYFAGFRVLTLTNPFGSPIELGWFSLPLSVLWLVGVTNAMNLLDGIDGLAAGVTVCIALPLSVIHILAGNVLVALLSLSVAGACLGFLPYNFSPARIFLGDSGSLLLGLTLGCMAMVSLFKGTTATLIMVPLILFAVPLIDAASVMVGRWRRGKPVFQADKTHIHHRLLALGLNQKQAAWFLYALTGLLGLLALCLNLQKSRESILWVSGASIVIVSLVWLAWRIRWTRNLRSRRDP